MANEGKVILLDCYGFGIPATGSHARVGSIVQGYSASPTSTVEFSVPRPDTPIEHMFW
jgi:hypothetical protein